MKNDVDGLKGMAYTNIKTLTVSIEPMNYVSGSIHRLLLFVNSKRVNQNKRAIYERGLI
jgi:hypothetical protein